MFLLKKSILFLSFYSLSLCLSAQQKVNSSTVLANTFATNPSGKEMEGLLFLKNNNHQLPWYDKMEFRTETDELDFERQEYLFRLSLNSKKEIDAYKKLHAANLKMYDIENSILKNELLTKRYEHLVTWYYTQGELSLLEKKKILLEDKKKVLQKMADNALVVDVEKLLENNEDLQDLGRAILQLEHQAKFSMTQLNYAIEEEATPNLDATDWISVEQMKAVIQELPLHPANNQELHLQQAKTAYAFSEQDIETAEAKKIFDFVQLKYAGRGNTSLQKEFSIGMGFNIPTKASGRLKRNKATLQYFDEKQEAKILEQELIDNIKISLADFSALVDEYEMIQGYIQNEALEKKAEKYLQQGDVDIQTILSIKAMMLKNDRTLYKIEHKICTRYLQLLAYSGALHQTPTLNYLTQNLSPFQLN